MHSFYALLNIEDNLFDLPLLFKQASKDNIAFILV